jgi:hypothetical protein
MDLVVERIPANHRSPTEFYIDRVIIVLDGMNLGVITSCDTLALVFLEHVDSDYDLGVRVGVYSDQLHQQNYQVLFKKERSGKFAIYIVPLKPYTRESLFNVVIKSQ